MTIRTKVFHSGLALRISALEAQHGGLRPAARALSIDPGYLKRLRDGEKTNPSAAVLRKLKLCRFVQYASEDARPTLRTRIVRRADGQLDFEE